MDLLSRKAMIDGLTGLWNRTYFESRLGSELSLSRRTGQPLSCIMLDLDHFKQLNDRFGHPFGDEVLRAMGRLLIDTCRQEDIACRYGGEEFVVLAPGVSPTDAVGLAERLRAAVESTSLTCRGETIKVTCSIGVSGIGHIPPPTIVDLADEALYVAKNGGRNRVVLAKPPPLPMAA
jgi:diguanylate cyclase (GGDEF)-like protein